MATVRRLGKGLAALIPPGPEGAGEDGARFTIPVDTVDSNPFQPRKEFGDEQMADLINSIQAKGIIQPLTVRDGKNGRYELIAGERRLRAAKFLGLDRLPAYILSVDSDVDMMEYALIENIQRENLNPVEQAEAFALLNSKYDLTQEEIGQQVGLSRPAVANVLRILRLSNEVKQSLKKGEITMGHARALLAVRQPALRQRLWRKIVKEGLSVRQAEAAVRELTERPAASRSRRGKKPDRPAFIASLEEELIAHLGTKVRVNAQSGEAGTIKISYYSHTDLERLFRQIIDSGTSSTEPASRLAAPDRVEIGENRAGDSSPR